MPAGKQQCRPDQNEKIGPKDVLPASPGIQDQTCTVQYIINGFNEILQKIQRSNMTLILRHVGGLPEGTPPTFPRKTALA